MGHEIESAAIKRGHTIGLTIDVDNHNDLTPNNLKEIDVAIEFSSPTSAYDNICKCIENSTPVVSGTTGWLDMYDKVVELCSQCGTSFIHSSNYSIGVNLFFKINGELAKNMKRYLDYNVSIEEIHHTKKLDSPSGTAISLANIIKSNNDNYHGWQHDHEKSSDAIPIRSIREGDVAGIHTVTWDSDIDIISLTHTAKGRKGFATGAVIAAEYIHDKKGVFTMNDVMGF